MRVVPRSIPSEEGRGGERGGGEELRAVSKKSKCMTFAREMSFLWLMRKVIEERFIDRQVFR